MPLDILKVFNKIKYVKFSYVHIILERKFTTYTFFENVNF